jgi:adenylosuccinate lyase
MREEGSDTNNLIDRLSEELEFKKTGITGAMLADVLKDKSQFLGNADAQITAVQEKTKPLLTKYPDEADYEPGDIL